MDKCHQCVPLCTVFINLQAWSDGQDAALSMHIYGCMPWLKQLTSSYRFAIMGIKDIVYFIRRTVINVHFYTGFVICVCEIQYFSTNNKICYV